MKVRSHNMAKLVGRTRSPPIISNKLQILHSARSTQRNLGPAPLLRQSTSDQNVRTTKQHPKNQNKLSNYKETNYESSHFVSHKNQKQQNGRTIKEEDDNTTQQSSQHVSYTAGEYQLESYEMFARRKNVKFEEKVVDVQTSKPRNSVDRSSARNSSILKKGSRALDGSIASSQKSLSIQNSFTASKRCKLTITSAEASANNSIKKKYEEIIANLKSKVKDGMIREKYIDDLFPPVQTSVFSSNLNGKTMLSKSRQEIVWLRIPQILQGRKMKIYSKNKKNQNLISSGGYCEPYLIACFNALKNNNELLTHLFEGEQVNPFGVYLIKIFKDNAWKNVIIDDFVPCIKRRVKGSREEGYFPAFLNVIPPENQTAYIWPYLIEKAYANHYTSYQNFMAGEKTDLLAQVMGNPQNTLTFENHNIQKNKKEAALVLLEKSLSEEGGVVVGHNEQKGLFCPLSLVQNNYLGENTLIAYKDYNSNEDITTVDLKDLPSLFSKFHIYCFNKYHNRTSCPVYPPKQTKKIRKSKEKQGKYIEIPPNDTISLRTFTLLKKTRCAVDIQQKDIRFSSSGDYIWIRCLLIQREYDGGYRWIEGCYAKRKHIIFEHNLDPGEYYLVVMAEWAERHNREITIVLHSEFQFVKFERKAYNRDERIIELASMDLAQRYGKFNQINRSICSYTLLNPECAMIIQNINNERIKGPVTVMRSINGLKSKAEILPLNKEFEIEVQQEYGGDRKEKKRGIGYSVELDIEKGQSYTVVLRMRGGIDHKFFKMFHFN